MHQQSTYFGKIVAGCIVGGILLIGIAVVTKDNTPRPNSSTSTPPTTGMVVGVHEKTCEYTNPATVRINDPIDYFEIRKGTRLKPADIQAMLVATCTEAVANNRLGELVSQLPNNTQGMQITPAFTIQKISPDSLTLKPDPLYNTAVYRLKPDLTFPHIDDNVLVDEGQNTIAYSSLRPGDTVRLIVQEQAGAKPKADVNPLNEPQTLTVRALLKTPALVADPDAQSTALANDVTRAEPCASNTHFCRSRAFAP